MNERDRSNRLELACLVAIAAAAVVVAAVVCLTAGINAVTALTP